MHFNKNGKIAKFYRFFLKDGDALPEDFCTYFWGLAGRVLATLLIPGQIVFWTVYGLFLLLKLVWTHKLTSLYCIASAIGAALMILLVVWLNKRRKRVRLEFLDEVKQITAAKIDSVKKRYCPRIEWK